MENDERTANQTVTNYHYLPIAMATIFKNCKFYKDVEKLESLCTTDRGCKMVQPEQKTVLRFFKKIAEFTMIQQLPPRYPEEQNKKVLKMDTVRVVVMVVQQH